MDETPEAQNQNGVGPVMSIIVLVLIFAVGGAYFFYQEHLRLNTPPIQEIVGATSTPESTSTAE